MSLRFPTARLHMHNLLADNISGADAIALAAMDFGLVNTNFVSHFQTEQRSTTPCCCSHAARSVLDEYFALRTASSNAPVDVNQVWVTLVGEATKYLRNDSTNPNNGPNPSPLGTEHDCTKLAPVMFDLMLQQIGQYP